MNQLTVKCCQVCKIEKPLDQFRDKRSRCKICLKEYNRLYRLNRPEKKRESEQRRRLKYPEKGRDILKRWYAENPGKRNEHRRNHHALKRGASGKFTVSEWESCKTRFGNRCVMCGAAEPLFKLTPDHIIPLSKGGPNSIDNIQPLCKPCNSSKHDKTIDLRPGAEVKPKRKKVRV